MKHDLIVAAVGGALSAGYFVVGIKHALLQAHPTEAQLLPTPEEWAEFEASIQQEGVQ